MAAGAFFDTNILIYALAADDARSATALALLHEGGRVSVQSLNEYANVALKKLRRPWVEIEAALDDIVTLCPKPVALTAEVHRAGLKLAQATGYGVYDALILAAALSAGSRVLYSEDLQHGQRIEDRLEIVNPFRTNR